MKWIKEKEEAEVIGIEGRARIYSNAEKTLQQQSKKESESQI